MKSPGGIETQKNSSDQIIASAIRTLFVNLRIKLDDVKKTREETGIFISRFLKLKKDLGNLKKKYGKVQNNWRMSGS